MASASKKFKKKAKKMVEKLKENGEEISSKLELSGNVTWASKLKKETLLDIYKLMVLYMYRTTPRKSGARGVGDDVSIFTTDNVISDFLEHFDVKPTFKENKPINGCHFPFTGGEYDEITWYITDYQKAKDFLCIFKHLQVPLDIAWVTDNKNAATCIRVDNPEETSPYLLHDRKRKKELDKFCESNNISAPIVTHLAVMIGNLKGRVKFCPFKIVYTRNLDPFLPGGTLKLCYYYHFNANGIVQGLVVEGEDEGEDEGVDEGVDEENE